MATTAKPRRRKPEKTLNEALYVRLECVSSEEDTESPSEGEPGDIVAALAQVNPDFAEIYAATLAANQRPGTREQKLKEMTCYFCKEGGHTWLKCSKLWDQLKLNGFKPNMSRDKGGTYPKKRSGPPRGGRTGDKGGSQPPVN